MTKQTENSGTKSAENNRMFDRLETRTLENNGTYESMSNKNVNEGTVTVPNTFNFTEPIKPATTEQAK